MGPGVSLTSRLTSLLTFLRKEERCFSPKITVLSRVIESYPATFVGVIGAILGGFLFRLVGLLTISLLGSLISATVGTILLLFLLQKFGKRP